MKHGTSTQNFFVNTFDTSVSFFLVFSDTGIYGLDMVCQSQSRQVGWPTPPRIPGSDRDPALITGVDVSHIENQRLRSSGLAWSMEVKVWCEECRSTLAFVWHATESVCGTMEDSTLVALASVCLPTDRWVGPGGGRV